MRCPAPSIRLGVVILAAGASKRMGRPKLLLPWGGTTILGHLLQEWRTVGADQIAVVCAEGMDAIQEELNRLGHPETDRIGNPRPDTGMLGSIQLAAQWTGWLDRLSHWAIVLGDQPHLRRTTIKRLIRFASEQPDRVSQPGYRGRRRHPVLLPQSDFAALAISMCSSLKEFLRAMPDRLAVCEMDDPGLDFDIDTPEDYECACQMTAAHEPEKN